MLIFICGNVGAGKTTLKYNLLKYLKTRRKVYSFSLLAFPLFSYVTYKMLAILMYGRGLVKLHEDIKIHPSTLFIKRVKRMPSFLLLVFTFIELMSIFPKYIWLLEKLRRNQVIIVDEGPINMMANYFEVFGSKHIITHPSFFLMRLVKNLKSKVDVKTVFLHSRSDVLIERWMHRKHPLPTNIIGLFHHIKYNKLVTLSKILYEKNVDDVLEIDTSQLEPSHILSLVVSKLGI